MPLSKITLRVNGKKIIPDAEETLYSSEYFTTDAVYEISKTRGETFSEVVTIEQGEFVELTFEDGSFWFGDQQTLQELFPILKEQTRSSDTVAELPLGITGEDATRGIIGNLAIKLLKKLLIKTVQKGIRTIATEVEDKGILKGEGLFGIQSNFDLKTFQDGSATVESDKPILLFIHGTSSSTKGAFSELEHTKLWNKMQNKYGNNILAWEHRTLTKGPFENVQELIEQLPANQVYDIISHSRGGIVGELLMRFSENPNGILDTSLQLLKDEGHDAEIKAIAAIQKLVADKKIKVGRFVRVACPAAGTSLLSNRTDIFLNTFINLINVASPVLKPVIGGLQFLISQTINSKNDFTELPGLEAQRPESIFMKVLNTYAGYDAQQNPVRFKNRVAVIAGNGKISFSLNGLKVILTKFFFKWGQNDLVVDTNSMYCGAKRNDPVQYFLDAGNNTNHFNYFTNDSTRAALEQAIFSTDETIPGFSKLTSESFDAQANRGIFGLDSGRLRTDEPKGKKPIVVLLPGIMGSFLEQHDSSLWINYWRFVSGGLLRLVLKEDDEIEATGIIKTAYKGLVDYLSENFDVVIFGFDWRKSVAEAGNQLDTRIRGLQKYNQPISFVAHSMGGLVVRDLMIQHSETWKILQAQQNFRVVLLGTPWLGSFRIPNVLAGKDSIIKQLSFIDMAHSKTTLINMFSKFPGLLDLLPVHGDYDFGSEKIWSDFVEATGLPLEAIPKNLLKQFSNYATLIKDKLGSIDYSNIVYVAGKDNETVMNYKIENGQLQFYSTEQGDQSVTWESGIPTQINKDRNLYYVNASHGSLAKKDFLFPGIEQILLEGKTDNADFNRQPDLVSSSNRSFATRENFIFESSEVSIESEILGLELFTEEAPASKPLLSVSVTMGDLMFAKYPILIGHFDYDGIYSAEAVANKYLNNLLALKYNLGLYPGPIGTSSYFPKLDSIEFSGAIIVGLGLAEKLNANQITTTIEKAVADYLIDVWKPFFSNKSKNERVKIGISSLLIGAGYLGMPIESSCRAVMLGVANANKKVMANTNMQDLFVSEIEFVELFEDKSFICHNSLNTLIKGNSDGLNIAWSTKKIHEVPGVRKRIMNDPTIDWWQRLSVLAKEDDMFDQTKQRRISFYSSTNNAREEVKNISSDWEDIELLFDSISTKMQWTGEKARALFEQMIPTDFKETIRRNSPVLWVLDKYTANFPWELIQPGRGLEKPLCVSAGMIRQLATGNYSKPGESVNTNSVLIIGDPDLDGMPKASQLEGAATEAKEIHKLFQEKAENVTLEDPLIRASSSEIRLALYKKDYKILHIAAHGFFDAENSNMRGLVIGKRKQTNMPVLLRPSDIAQLPSPPQLVFVNSCFLGKINPYEEQLSQSRYQLAANIGTQLIESGVKAVVVAGWEVDDQAALFFAKTFYEKMLENINFGDAVLAARKEVFNNFKNTNTWGAFQCYGRPDFKLDIKKPQSVDRHYDISQQAENDLDNLISKSEVLFYDPVKLKDELQDISKAIDEAKFDNPSLLQTQARAYVELNDYDKAIDLFSKLFGSENAIFKVKTLELFQDIRVKQTLQSYLTNEKVSEQKFKEFMEIIDKSIDNLKNLLEIGKTAERYNLLGSAFKRKARIAKKKEEKIKLLEMAAENYFTAYKICPQIYSFSNWLLISSLIYPAKQTWKVHYKVDNHKKTENISGEKLPEMLQSLVEVEKTEDKVTFWSLSGKSDFAMCHYLLNPKDADNLKNWKEAKLAVIKRVGSIDQKQRVVDHLNILIHFADEFGLSVFKKDFQELLESI